MRVLVCGGRKFNDPWFVTCRLGEINITHLIEGGAPGVDTMAREWAEINNIPFTEYPAEWHKYGNRAGPIRNAQMLKEGKPDLVIAFPGGEGTANMIAQAERARIPVNVVMPVDLS